MGTIAANNFGNCKAKDQVPNPPILIPVRYTLSLSIEKELKVSCSRVMRASFCISQLELVGHCGESAIKGNFLSSASYIDLYK